MSAELPTPIARVARRGAVSLVGLAVAGLLVACGSGGGGGDAVESAEGTGSGKTATTLDISNLGKTTTTDPADREPATTTSTTLPAAKDPDANGCRAVQTMFLVPAGNPAYVPAEVSGPARQELAGQVQMVLPPMERVQFRELMAFDLAYSTDPNAQPPAGFDPEAVIDHLIRWANDTCPPPRPAWACIARQTFVPVGNAIGAEGTPDLEAGTHPTPDAVIGSTYDGGAGSIKLGETADTAWFGWTNDVGLVTRVQEVEQVGGGWKFGADSTCPEHANTARPGSGEPGSTVTEDQFEVIGSEVPSNEPTSSAPPEGPSDSGFTEVGNVIN